MVTQVSKTFAAPTTFRTAQSGLQKIVQDLSENSDIAMARIWLVQPAEFCEVCVSRNEHHEFHEPSLHLVASAGQSRDPKNPEVWNRLGGAFHRFPLNSHKIGQIGATGKPLLVHHKKGETELLNPNWLTREGIQSFFGYPLVSDGQIWGVFAVFSRPKLTERDLRFLTQIADGGLRLLQVSSKLSEQQYRLCRLTSENEQLRLDLETSESFGPLVACGPASRKLNEQIRIAADHRQPLLIQGERGSGKEFTAREIHRRGIDQTDPFVKVVGHALSKNIVEAWARSEEIHPVDLQAVSQFARFEGYSIGTLFIDAVDQVSSDVQEILTKIVLSPSFAGEHSAADSRLPKPRIIVSSTVDLQSAVAAGRFRHDLYCALSVTEIHVPPLRQRQEDLPFLAAKIVKDVCHREHRDELKLDSTVLTRLAQYDWPGNVRELQYVLGCAVIQAIDGQIVVDDYLKMGSVQQTDQQPTSFVRADALKRQERANILACLKRCDWKVYGRGGAAEQLGIKPTTLMYRMKVLGIRKPAK
jgi:transcriptional regulator with GAF, ATPase, and Fis domain